MSKLARLAPLFRYPIPTIVSAAVVSSSVIWAGWQYSKAIEQRALMDGAIQMSRKLADDNLAKIETERNELLRQASDRANRASEREAALKREEYEANVRAEEARQAQFDRQQKQLAEQARAKAEAEEARKAKQIEAEIYTRNRAIVSEYQDKTLKILNAMKGKPSDVVVAAHRKERDRVIAEMASRYLLYVDDVKQILRDGGIDLKENR